MKTLRFWFPVALLLLLSARAGAHAMQVATVISYDPAAGTLQVELRDPYNNLIPTGQVAAALGPAGKPPRSFVALKEESAGIHRGKVTGAGEVLHLKVEWPGERWAGEIPVEKGKPLEAVPFSLMPIEESSPARSNLPWWLPAVGAVVLFAAVWFVSNLFAGKESGK